MRLLPQLKNIHLRLLERADDGQPMALATIIDTRGSTPQMPGFSALFGHEGLIMGTLGGGILEKDAERRAEAALRTQRSELYEFDLEADLASSEGAICGGSVRILIDAQPARNAPAFQALCAALKKRVPGALVTTIERKTESPVLRRSWIPSDYQGEEAVHPAAWARFRNQIAECLEQRRPGLFLEEGASSPADPTPGMLFVEPIFPLPRLLIAGAGHIGKSVAHLGHRLEFEVTVIDDRPEFANPENVPDADDILVGEIGPTISSLPLEADTYIVIVTRGHQHDAEALRACIAAPSAYLGMIGSRTKIALMRGRFLDRGWATAEQWDRIHAPIGIDIRSQTVEEIAVSIAAQLVLTRSLQTKKHSEA
jgi:xanthine dehydrogenase accessory factor